MHHDERRAIELLSECRFAPGTWDKKFARSLAERTGGAPLTTKQREQLWRMVLRYKRQLTAQGCPAWLMTMARRWQSMTADEKAFCHAIYNAPDDEAPRLVFADWLDEHGRHEDAGWMRRRVKPPASAID